LIDPDGKIIAKDLRGPSLEAKLAELFDWGILKNKNPSIRNDSMRVKT
jgi:hypothetical protein